MKPDKLLLWDIDGTLIHSGHAGERAIVRAWKAITDIDVDLTQIDYSGRTDRMIGQMLFEHFQLPLEKEKHHLMVETYLEFLKEEVPTASAGRRLPGVIEVLEEAIQRPDIVQGLLTGNMGRGAETKLTHYNLWHYFEFGAFADDSHIRDELGPFALRRAAEKYGYDFAPSRVFIIGDTPHDIQCARVIGARAIAVATGSSPLAELEAHKPDALFTDFNDLPAFFKTIDHLSSQ